MKKTKKLALILIIAVILQIFAACGDNGGAISETPAAADTNKNDNNNLPEAAEDIILSDEIPHADSSFDDNDNHKPETDEYYFIYNDYYILLNEDYERAAAKIGAANDTFEVPSCAFEGIDKMFYYDDFMITTYPDGDKDFILSITLTGENIKTPEGVGLGMSFEDMINAYGDDYDNNLELYSYTRGDIELAFLFENDILADINYYYLPATGG